MELKHINAKVSSATHGLLLVYAKTQGLTVSKALDQLVRKNLQGMKITANRDGKLDVSLDGGYDLKKLKALRDEGMKEYRAGKTRTISTEAEWKEYTQEVLNDAK
ncbi:hypothetical protein CO051_00130 [Candidatus Roizmanbacteria bacterium CG_4_9_14_0_2_um_filter_39_13]|uniref:Uncharacterized protein n=2 Tax=Candidatus Roizmaniibacteriota TaxID=1752723 RepID=A0A2M8F524_9BACT|nr:MAG: hypothetical protein COY15_03900 [Candidatus Roizmanbacteria bacterium CG_4_10_14_0_2_um_filter_39_12]PJC34311.1 MAG: hypothetical protein CO051_00130 [Candidatus Roizmanbacteria bacterium CG_4_9_14_0_2_um_filter_39_13]PJE61864.1 MAG: hypothetical protein COU87_02305 [Candidatus Roizmanbacteria bacterium CG10_big_fil_rev_8_21_14_0_10_39_12]